MKKIISFLLACAMIFSLAGCNNSTTTSSENSSSQNNTTTTNSDILAILSDTNATYQDVFTKSTISTVNIKISEEDWKDICDNATNEEYHQADVVVNGTTVSKVGFRAKGNSTLRSVAQSDSDRYGFKIKFDKYVDDQTLNGLDMLVLNGSYADPSYMREYLAYSVSQSVGAITPYVSYTKLYINDEYFGLYLSIESYKDSFVERNTSDKNAVLYKADGENCTLTTSDTTSGFEIEYGKDKDNSILKNFITVLNNTTSDNYAQLEKVLDVDSVLKAMAINVVTGNYDSYSGSKAHNYYLLYADGKFTYIGWDYNMAFGGFVEDGGSSITVDVNSPFYNVNTSQRPLMSKLLEIQSYKERYLAYIEQIKSYLADFDSKISTIADFIREDVKTDPTAFYTIEEFEQNIVESGNDLSQNSGKGQMGGQRPTIPSGDNNQANGQLPALPSGDNNQANGQLPALPSGDNNQANGQLPALPSGDNNQANGQLPALPSGDNNQANGQLPALPSGDNNQANGQLPAMPSGDNNQANGQFPNRGGMGDGMIKTNTVSIYDYIKQRLANL